MESTPIDTISLRSLGLTSSNVISIADCCNQNEVNKPHPIKSISFSYNRFLGNLGAKALIQNLPKSICSLGLVNCSLGDIDGM